MRKLLLLLLTSLWLLADGPVLKTGQTTVHQEGDDGTYQAGTAHSYTRDSVNGIVTDNVTGLVWQDNTLWTEFWTSAGTHCDDLSLGGHDDWRLPAIQELNTLVDHSRTQPSIDPIFQSGAESYFFWSSTTHAGNSSYAWGVSFSDGGDLTHDKSNSIYNIYAVRCVRGASTSATTYVRDNTSQTVYDSQTNLTWQDDANVSSQAKTWSNAINYCENLNFAGQTDWRLPSINELHMIANHTIINPAIDPVFQNVASYYYRSSTTYAGDPTRAWSVSFESGYGVKDHKSTSSYVRCVRGGQFDPLPPTSNAGTDQSVTVGTAVTLDASGSGDSDGNITSYEWKEGTTILGTSSTLIKSNFLVGTHTITLTVTDNSGATASDEVIVTVTSIPREILNASGTVTNSLDFLHQARYYQFTLTEKSKVTINAGATTALNTAGWLSDSNGTKISRLNNWDAGLNRQFRFEEVLEAGTYNFDIFDENAGFGTYSFVFDTTKFVDLVAQPWNITIPSTIKITKGEFINIPLNIEPNEFINLDTSGLSVTSNTLPAGIILEKGGLYSIRGKVESLNNFEITLNINDTINNFTKEHKISFEVSDFSIDGIIGDGQGAKVVVKKVEGGAIKPFKVAFDVKGYSSSEIESVTCKFRNDPILSVTTYDGEYYANGTAKFSCDVGLNQFKRGASSVEDFMNKLVAIDEAERFLTIVVNLKNGTSVEKKILKPISVEEIGGWITLRQWGEDESTSGIFYGGQITIYKVDGSEEHYGNDNPIIDTTFRIDYGDEVIINGGRWTLVVDNHEMLINLIDVGPCKGVSFIASKDNVNNEILLKYNYLRTGELINMYVKRNTSSKSVQNNSEQLLKLSMHVGNMWTKATNVDDCSGFENFHSDDVAGVRGTTFSITNENNETKYEVYEGIVDINKSGTVTTLNSMESFATHDGAKKLITKVNLPLVAKQYLDETSLYQADFNTTVSRLNITTNLAEASYILIGDNVRVGGGTVNSFNNIAEGNYTLRFLPVVGKITPPEIPFIVTKEASDISLNGNYSDGLKLNDGWSLIGLGTDVNVTNTHWNALFGSAKIMWKYKDSTWKAYSSFDTIKSAINTAGYTLFDTINAGEGVWIQSDTNQTLAIDTNESTYQLSIPTTKGWHLKSTPQTISVTSFTANRTDITYVWTYNNGTWALWAKDGLQRGFDSLDTIYAHAGFWALVR